MSIVVIYPGTFDPITLGHVDLIHRASHLFDRLIIGIAKNENKEPLFTFEERLALVRRLFSDLPHIEISGFQGLLADFAKEKEANIILRGLRVVSDFDYEFQMASMNRTLDVNLETVFLMPAEQYTYVSSTLVREIASKSGNVSRFVPPIVEEAIKEKVQQVKGATI